MMLPAPNRRSASTMLLALCLLCIALLSLTAPHSSAATVQVDANKPLISLGKGLEYVAAPNGETSLDSARSIAPSRWQTSHSDSVNLSYTDHPYWFRTTLYNPGKTTLLRQLEIAYPVLDYIDLFIVNQAGQSEHLRLGDKYPFSARPYWHRHFVIPLQITAGQSVQLYLRVQTSSAMQIPLLLWQAEARDAQDQQQNLLQGLYFGTMLVMLLYNLILFFGIRDWNYLLYVLWTTCMAGFLSAFNGLAFQYLWPNATHWNDQSIVVLLALANAFGAAFSLSFLQMRKNLPRSAPALQAMIALALLAAIAAFWLPYQLAIKFTIFNAVASILLIMAAAIHLWSAGYKAARLFILSWSSVLIGGTILAMNKFGLLPSNLFTEHAAQVGSALEAMLLSLAMVDRFNSERKNSELSRIEMLHAQQTLLDVQRHQNEALENRVRERTEELEQANLKLQEMSSTDALTGTHNRRYFDQAYASELKRMHRDNTDLSLLLLDIDHFKQINDNWGHQIGDECLKLVAQTIGQHIQRDSDTLARVGGEEFCILLPNTNAAGAVFLAETIRGAIEALSTEINGHQVAITASIGITSSSQQLPTPAEQLLNLADKALYRAKQLGRNRVCLFEPGTSPHDKIASPPCMTVAKIITWHIIVLQPRSAARLSIFDDPQARSGTALT